MLPNTTALAGRVLALPTGTAVGAGEISVICQVLRTAVSDPAVIRKLLPDEKQKPDGSKEIECLATGDR
jgi:hypothetical protein